MNVDRLDHLVLTVHDVAATIEFYTRVMGMRFVVFGNGRHALSFGNQKINLHSADAPVAPYAQSPTPGSADLCFITDVPVAEVITHLHQCGVAIEQGPVLRTGANGPILSVYFRDPDGNLLEVSNEKSSI